MKIEDIMSQFSGKGVPWGPTLTPSAAEELELYLIELTKEVFSAGFDKGYSEAMKRAKEREESDRRWDNFKIGDMK